MTTTMLPRRLRRSLIPALAASALSAGLAFAASTGFGVNYSSGGTNGTFSWYNRSVGVQGQVWDWSGGSAYTTAVFAPMAGSYTLPQQTRTANNGATTSFSFTLDGSPYSGGITYIGIGMCSSSACTLPIAGYTRPA